jgi:potassium-transporting ATPase KdpC subunit
MKTLFVEIKTSLLATLVLAVLLCGAYPVLVWGGGQLLFRDKANGSLIVEQDGTIRGSRLLAQSFANDRYFHPRPSSAGAGYDAANSSGSNLGPTSQKLADLIKADTAAYREKNGMVATAPVPADAVTRSGSGLDPHISVTNAEHQASRVARVRHLPLEKVRALIATHTEDRGLRILGEPGVNVLMLNRALDSAAPVASR